MTTKHSTRGSQVCGTTMEMSDLPVFFLKNVLAERKENGVVGKQMCFPLSTYNQKKLFSFLLEMFKSSVNLGMCTIYRLQPWRRSHTNKHCTQKMRTTIPPVQVTKTFLLRHMNMFACTWLKVKQERKLWFCCG